MTHSLIGTSQELIIEREMEADRSSESSKTPQTEEPLESSNNESSGDSSESEELYDVEKIVGHKREDDIEYFKVRWVGYGPKDDTWEPEHNLVGETIRNMIIDYRAKNSQSIQKRKETAKRKKEAKAMSSEPHLTAEPDEKTIPDEVNLADQLEESWYGISSNERNRESRRLYVADRIYTESEKILAETKPGERILRHQLRTKLTPTQQVPPKKYEDSIYTTDTPKKSRKRSRIRTSKSKESNEEPKSKRIPEDNDEDIEIVIIKSGKTENIVSRKDTTNHDHKPSGMAVKRPDQPNHGFVGKPNVGLQDLKMQGSNLIPKFGLKEKGAKIEKGASRDITVTHENKEFVPPILPPASSEKDEQKEEIQRTKDIAVSKGMLKKIKPKGPKSHVESEKPMNIPDKTSTNLSRKSKTSGIVYLKTAELLTNMNSRAKRERLISEKFELPLSILGPGELTRYIVKTQTSNSKKAQSVQALSQQEFEEAVIDGKIDLIRDVLHKHNSMLDLNRMNADGQTLIHRLSEFGCSPGHSRCDLIDILVKYGARMDFQDHRGRIPLQIAIENQRLCHVRKLIELHSPINIENKVNKLPIITALERCRNSSSEAFIDSLLNAGASFQAVFKALRSESRQNLSQELLPRLINPHQKRLQDALDLARKTVLLSIANARAVTPIFVNPLYEFKEVKHTFRYDGALPGPNFCYLIFISLADFLPDKVVARMWGPTPVTRVLLNGEDCEPLIPANKFIYLCLPRQSNQLSIFLTENNSDLKIISQIALVQFLPRNFS